MTSAVVFWKRHLWLFVRSPEVNSLPNVSRKTCWNKRPAVVFLVRTVSRYLMTGNNSRHTAPVSSQDVIGPTKWSSTEQERLRAEAVRRIVSCSSVWLQGEDSYMGLCCQAPFSGSWSELSFSRSTCVRRWSALRCFLQRNSRGKTGGNLYQHVFVQHT